MAGHRIEQHQQTHQHEYRSGHGIEHEIQGCGAAVLATPAIDKEKQRDQGQFPEHVEKRPVLGHEDAHHGRLQYQYQQVVAFYLFLDAGRGQYRDKAEQCGQKYHREGEAIYTQGEGGAQARVPVVVFVKL